MAADGALVAVGYWKSRHGQTGQNGGGSARKRSVYCLSSAAGKAGGRRKQAWRQSFRTRPARMPSPTRSHARRRPRRSAAFRQVRKKASLVGDVQCLRDVVRRDPDPGKVSHRAVLDAIAEQHQFGIPEWRHAEGLTGSRNGFKQPRLVRVSCGGLPRNAAIAQSRQARVVQPRWRTTLATALAPKKLMRPKLAATTKVSETARRAKSSAAACGADAKRRVPAASRFQAGYQTEARGGF